jgi:cytochrome d ubiquinol oxidase subunit II
LIDAALAPIWEANHVWLILIVVLLFVCFPVAFSEASIALHIPITLMLIGIVLRGAGFAFQHYAANESMRRRWSRTFALASFITPFFLGVALGAVTAGRMTAGGDAVERFVTPWLNPFGLIVGMFGVAIFAFVAAVYLLNEAPDESLQRAFRTRAIGSGLVVGVMAFAAIGTARIHAPRFFLALMKSWWSWPLQIATALIAISLFSALLMRRHRIARLLVIAQTALIIGGWAAAQHPLLIAPSWTIEATAAPDRVIRATLAALAAGSAVLAPSLWLLFRLFKSRGD